MAQEDNDLQKIAELIEIMKNNDLVEVEIKHGDDKILLKRSQSPDSSLGSRIPSHQPLPTSNQQQEAPPPLASQQADEGLVEIKSPIVGTYYATPSPDSESFVEPGSKIDPQTVVCIIEAMKVMNEIKAQTTGTIVVVLVTNGQAVEYDQVLFKVKPD